MTRNKNRVQKYVGIGVVVLLVASLIGYSFFWYKRATEIRKNTEQMIAQILLPSGKNGQKRPLLTYEKIALRGYPFYVTLVFQKPVVHIPTLGYDIESQFAEVRSSASMFKPKSIALEFSKQADVSYIKTGTDGKKQILLELVKLFEDKPQLSIVWGENYQWKQHLDCSWCFACYVIRLLACD